MWLQEEEQSGLQALPESCTELKRSKDLTKTKGLDLPRLCATRGSLQGWGQQGGNTGPRTCPWHGDTSALRPWALPAPAGNLCS